ncbi:MAG: RNA polymerase sigma-70 factor (ECF subfamily) [Saprospiraceae bacterium]|jgi:RNA polymerase sigma-70 factor (ECF subfamily)
MATEQLIQEAQKGNQSAIQKLYEYYETYWFRLCLRYGRNRSEAQDIFQEGAVQVFQKLEKFDVNRGNFKSWSSRVIINQALKYLKKHQWQQSFEDLETIENEVDFSIHIIEKISAKELIEVIQQLPTGYRMIFNMHEIEGFSHREIAEALHISVGTSKSQLSKAKRMLREKLKVIL